MYPHQNFKISGWETKKLVGVALANFGVCFLFKDGLQLLDYIYRTLSLPPRFLTRCLAFFSRMNFILREDEQTTICKGKMQMYGQAFSTTKAFFVTAVIYKMPYFNTAANIQSHNAPMQLLV